MQTGGQIKHPIAHTQVTSNAVCLLTWHQCSPPCCTTAPQSGSWATCSRISSTSRFFPGRSTSRVICCWRVRGRAISWTNWPSGLLSTYKQSTGLQWTHISLATMLVNPSSSPDSTQVKDVLWTKLYYTVFQIQKNIFPLVHMIPLNKLHICHASVTHLKSALLWLVHHLRTLLQDVGVQVSEVGHVVFDDIGHFGLILTNNHSEIPLWEDKHGQ